MDLFVNDLSIHRQFSHLNAFRKSLAELAAMRKTAQRWNRDVYCNRKMCMVEPMPGKSLFKIGLPEAERRAVMSWLTRSGPFWDDASRHGEGEWLECGGKIVTDSAVGEAAFRCLNGTRAGLISVAPSYWNVSPISVAWRWNDQDTDDLRTAEVENWWSADALHAALEKAKPPLASWNQLQEDATRRCDSLCFGEKAFWPLRGVPFARGAADRLAVCFNILNRLAGCFDENGVRTPEGEQMMEQYVHGDKAIFSDSSDTEKNKFKQKLSFPHPARPDEKELFGWHGKMSRHTIRFHFSWPVRANEPIYVVYVGPKLTK